MTNRYRQYERFPGKCFQKERNESKWAFLLRILSIKESIDEKGLAGLNLIATVMDVSAISIPATVIDISTMTILGEL